VAITFKSNGVEAGQPFVEIQGLRGNLPIQLTLFSVLKNKQRSTGSTGATGTIGAGD